MAAGVVVPGVWQAIADDVPAGVGPDGEVVGSCRGDDPFDA